MGRCSYCGQSIDLPFKCRYCEQNFCATHRLPENHNCSGIPYVKKPLINTIQWGKCNFCHKLVNIRSQCEYCRNLFCIVHENPQNHNCIGLEPRGYTKKPKFRYRNGIKSAFKAFLAIFIVSALLIIIVQVLTPPPIQGEGIYYYVTTLPTTLPTIRQSTVKYSEGNQIQKSSDDPAYDRYTAWIVIQVNNDETYTIGQIYYDRNENKWWKSDDELPKIKFIGLIDREYPVLIGNMNWKSIPPKYTYVDCEGNTKYSWSQQPDCAYGGGVDSPTPISTYQVPISPSGSISSKPAINTIRIEQRIHELVNQERNKAGLTSLSLENCITNVARLHSLDMANKDYFSHDNQEGEDPTDRGNELGCYCRKYVTPYSYYEGLAENIFQTYLYSSYWTTNGVITSYDWKTEEEIASSAVKGWMNSPGHRQNILTARYDEEGIGVAVSNDGKVYITQDFC